MTIYHYTNSPKRTGGLITLLGYSDNRGDRTIFETKLYWKNQRLFHIHIVSLHKFLNKKLYQFHISIMDKWIWDEPPRIQVNCFPFKLDNRTKLSFRKPW